MTEAELIEALAAKEHESWARWMLYFFGKCEPREDGALVIPAGYVEALRRQAFALYDFLSEREKQYDRDEVAHILPIIQAYCNEAISASYRDDIRVISRTVLAPPESQR